MPLLLFPGLRLLRRAELHILQRVAAIEGKDDVSVSVAADAESVQRFMADLPLFEVGVDGVGSGLEPDIRQRILLSAFGDGAERLRPLSKMRRQLFKPSTSAAAAPLADVNAVRQIESKCMPVCILTAVAEGTQLRNSSSPRILYGDR